MMSLRRPGPYAALSMLALAALLSGCASAGAQGPGGGPTQPAPSASSVGVPLDPDVAILRVEQFGGMIGAVTTVTQLPVVSVFADGRVITEAPHTQEYPGPALPGLQVQQIGRAAAGTLVGRAIAAGVHPGADVGRSGVQDAPSTRFTVVTSAGTQKVEVDSLSAASPDDPELTAAQQAARGRLVGLLRELTSLPASLGPTAPYVPTVVAAAARPYLTGGDGTPLPAVRWPGPALPGKPLNLGGDLGCVTVSGRDLAPVLAAARAAKSTTPWTSGGKRWGVYLRPMLPDETGCAGLHGTR